MAGALQMLETGADLLLGPNLRREGRFITTALEQVE